MANNTMAFPLRGLWHPNRLRRMERVWSHLPVVALQVGDEQNLEALQAENDWQRQEKL